MRLLIVGFGNVGRSLARLISKEEEYSGKIRVVCIADSKTQIVSNSGLDLADVIRRKEERGTVGDERRVELKELIERCDPDTVVELTNTNPVDGEPGFSHIRDAIVSGRDVVTANKGPIAIGFHALRELALRNRVQLRYSGTVGAGTPILDFGKTCSRGDKIMSIKGILNSTSNYVLSLMESKGVNMREAIDAARKEGYAEADVTMDISGRDSALKLVIIANHLLGTRITPEEVKTTGIEHIELNAIRKALKKGKRIRLVANAGSDYTVSPQELDESDPLCVSGPMNSFCIKCKYSGEKYVIGKGAGGMETAVAVLRDILSIGGR